MAVSVVVVEAFVDDAVVATVVVEDIPVLVVVITAIVL